MDCQEKVSINFLSKYIILNYKVGDEKNRKVDILPFGKFDYALFFISFTLSIKDGFFLLK